MYQVRHTIRAALVLLVTAVACGEETDDRAERSGARAGPPRPTVERLSTRVELDTAPDALTAVGDTVVAFADAADDQNPDQLLHSNDLGATWQPLTLPDAPASPAFAYTSRGTMDGVGYVTGVEDATPDRPPYVADNVYMWASRDGTSWRGGRLPIEGDATSITDPGIGVAADGNLIAGVVTSTDDTDGVEMLYSSGPRDGWRRAEMDDVVIDGAQTFVGDIWSVDDGRVVATLLSDSLEDELTVLESHDDGRSWQIGTCPDDSAVDGDDCRRPTDDVSLQVGSDGVSVDGGDRQTPVLDPPLVGRVSDDVEVYDDDVVELPQGGWLAVGSIPVDGGNTPDVLARSDDGVTWRPLVADDPCLADGHVPLFTRPVRLGAGWLVVHECQAIDHDAPPVTDGIPATTPVWSDIYVLDGAATEAAVVPGSPQDGHAYGAPLAVGDVVLVPVPHDVTDDGLTEVVRLTP